MDEARSKLFPIIPLSLTAVIVAGLIATSGAEGLSQSAATVIAIASMEVGAAPANFEFARTGQGGQGQWTVMSDPTAFSGRAIEQSSTDRTDYRFPLAIFKSIVAKNVDVSARFKPRGDHRLTGNQRHSCAEGRACHCLGHTARWPATSNSRAAVGIVADRTPTACTTSGSRTPTEVTYARPPR